MNVFIDVATHYQEPLCRKQNTLFIGRFWFELVKIYIVNTLGILEMGHSLQNSRVSYRPSLNSFFFSPGMMMTVE